MTLEELLEELGLEAEAGEKIEAYASAFAAGLKATNANLKSEKRKLQSDLAGFSGLNLEAIAEALGLDADELEYAEIPDLIATVKATGEPPKDDLRVAELERKLAKATKRAEDAERSSAETRDRLSLRLASRDMETQASAAITAASGSVRALMPHIKGRVKSSVDEDGEITHTILAPNGEPMEDAAGNPATFKMLVDEFHRDDDLSRNFDAPVSDVLGVGGRRKGTAGTTKKWSEMDLDEKMDLKAKNPALASRLKADAV
jgi:hypothetical protein